MQHESVMLKPSIDLLCQKPAGKYLDCTGGSGGHAAAILERLDAGGRLWICDYHQQTVEKLQARFASEKRVTVLRSRFSLVFDNLDFSFDGILADLGISSPQLADPALGIGFLVDAPLDMRIDSSLRVTAHDILRTTPEEQLAEIFYQFGGETAARKMARIIVHDRAEGRCPVTTGELRDLCARVLGRYYRGKRIHPATKIFQALRIAVNHEMEELDALLTKAPQHLFLHGRFVVISFHAGEDGRVKRKFRELSGMEQFEMVERKAIKPERSEVLGNVRARSARLRALEKVQ